VYLKIPQPTLNSPPNTSMPFPLIFFHLMLCRPSKKLFIRLYSDTTFYYTITSSAHLKSAEYDAPSQNHTIIVNMTNWMEYFQEIGYGIYVDYDSGLECMMHAFMIIDIYTVPT
jgi:hypothetical protein